MFSIICIYVYDIKRVDFSKYKIIKNLMNENKTTIIYIVIYNMYLIIC